MRMENCYAQELLRSSTYVVYFVNFLQFFFSEWWNSIKQLRLLTKHRWTLHFKQDTNVLYWQFSFLHRTAFALDTCTGKCPMLSKRVKVVFFSVSFLTPRRGSGICRLLLSITWKLMKHFCIKHRCTWHFKQYTYDLEWQPSIPQLTGCPTVFHAGKWPDWSKRIEWSGFFVSSFCLFTGPASSAHKFPFSGRWGLLMFFLIFSTGFLQMK